MKTLAMIITSDAYPDQVAALTQAAHQKGLCVHVHLTGTGVRLINTPQLDQVDQLATVTICRESVNAYLTGGCHGIKCPQWLVASSQMARLVDQCDRHLVF
jgi:hypothetical protein